MRLNEFARAVRLQGVTPGEIASLPAVAAAELVKGWKFEREEALIARDVVAEITQRLNFLQAGGAGLPLPGPQRHDAFRRETQLHPPGIPAGLPPARRALRAG